MKHGMLFCSITLILGEVFAEGNIPGPPGNFNFQTPQDLFNSRPDYRTSLFPGTASHGADNFFNGAVAAHTIPLTGHRDDWGITAQIFLYKLKYSMPFILIPLAYTGLNVLLREYAYREDVSKNNMGLANSFVSLSILGAAAGGAAGIFFNDDGFGKIIWGGLGAIIGFTAGVYIASIPQAQNAFRDNAYLYYSAPLIVGAAAAFPITLIWRD